MKAKAIVIASPDDIHALAVQKRCESDFGVPCDIVDTASVPQEASLDFQIDNEHVEHTLRPSKHSPMDFHAVLGIWRRRVLRHEISANLNVSADRSISRRDTKDAVDGFLLTLADRVRLMNDPRFEGPALNKLHQLAVAKGSGILVPKTLVSSHQQSVEEFSSEIWAQGRGVIYKAFASPEGQLIPTRVFENKDRARLGDLKFAPAIFQEFVSGRDLRITYVGGALFAAEIITTLPHGQTDWRTEAANKVVPFNLAPEMQRKIIRLMEQLQLAYGAIDFKLSPTGEFVFLEVNPWGQYLFVEIQTNLQISREIARWLVNRQSPETLTTT